MPIHSSSRYLRQPTLQIIDDRGIAGLVYEQRDTTVFEADRPRGSRAFVPEAGNSFPSLARKHLGRQQFWWLIADMNPEIFYPLDLADSDEIRVPPRDSLARFQRRR